MEPQWTDDDASCCQSGKCSLSAFGRSLSLSDRYGTNKDGPTTEITSLRPAIPVVKGFLLLRSGTTQTRVTTKDASVVIDFRRAKTLITSYCCFLASC